MFNKTYIIYLFIYFKISVIFIREKSIPSSNDNG